MGTESWAPKGLFAGGKGEDQLQRGITYRLSAEITGRGKCAASEGVVEPFFRQRYLIENKTIEKIFGQNKSFS